MGFGFMALDGLHHLGWEMKHDAFNYRRKKVNEEAERERQRVKSLPTLREAQALYKKFYLEKAREIERRDGQPLSYYPTRKDGKKSGIKHLRVEHWEAVKYARKKSHLEEVEKRQNTQYYRHLRDVPGILGEPLPGTNHI